MAESLVHRRRSRQEDVELKTVYHVSEELPPDTKSISYDAEAHDGVWGDTQNDIRDMQRLGKKQEFKVAFPIPLVAFGGLICAEKLQLPFHLGLRINLYGDLGVCSGVRLTLPLSDAHLVDSIECRSLSAGLINGGFGGLFWTWCGTVTCYATIVASLAEMESM